MKAEVKRKKRKNTEKMKLHAMIHSDTLKPAGEFVDDKGKTVKYQEKRVLTLLDLDRPRPLVHLLEIVVPINDSVGGDARAGASLSGQTAEISILEVRPGRNNQEVGVVGQIDRIVGQMEEKARPAAKPSGGQ